MEILDNNFESSLFGEQAKAYLHETAKWSRFLSILGFVFIGIIVIFAFAAGTIFSTLSSVMLSRNNPAFDVMGGMGTFLTVIYLIFAAIYFFPTFYLFQFSTKAINAIKNGSGTLLTEALKNLKSSFKFWGVFSIIILSLYGIVLVIALIGLAFK